MEDILIIIAIIFGGAIGGTLAFWSAYLYDRLRGRR